MPSISTSTRSQYSLMLIIGLKYGNSNPIRNFSVYGSKMK